MATEVPGLKQVILDEDVKTGAAASEATMTKFAGTMNLLLATVGLPVHFDIHGPYNIVGVPDDMVDKFFTVPFDCDILFSHFYTGENNGTSGNSEIDVIRKPLVGVEASIFTTRPIIPAGVAEADIIQEFLPVPANIRLAAGATAPVLASSQLSKYDVLKFNFIDKPVGTVDKLGFMMFLRPR